MPERIIFHNPEHTEHGGWVDPEGKPWDVPERLLLVVDSLLSDDTRRIEWLVAPELHPETLDLIAKAHSIEMIEAIAQASKQAEAGHPVKTRFDRGAETDASAIHSGTFQQALMSAECAVSAADALVARQTELAITVSRPPGHHAGREFYHGFCYFNPAAIAAEALKENGMRVAILDFDIHHGDGTQDIFYDDPNVMYASLHADPTLVLPGTGFAHEVGNHGTMVNRPLPIGVGVQTYMDLLDEVNASIADFAPDVLIIEAGFDGHKDEFPHLPSITQLGDEEYHKIGQKIGGLELPSLVIFGGGYNQDVTSSAFLRYIQGMDVGSGRRLEGQLYTDTTLLDGEG